MAFGYYLQATFESGYVLTEDDNDHSPYDPGKNVFNAILHGRPTDFGHGKMTKLALLPADGDEGYEINWRPFWAKNPRPIYYRDMTRQFQGGVAIGPATCSTHHFGIQYVDAAGKCQKDIIDIPAV